MAALEKIEDHVEQGLALLLSQYQNKPRIKALVSSYLRRVQELEDAAWDVRIKRLLDDAQGLELLKIGRIVGQPNAHDWDDDTYRTFIKARIRANNSGGHGDDVIEVLRLIEAADFVLREYYPATMFADYSVPTTEDPIILIELARLAKGGGVRLQLLYGVHAIGTDAFSFCDGTTDVASTTEGSSLTDESTGGYSSGVVE